MHAVDRCQRAALTGRPFHVEATLRGRLFPSVAIICGDSDIIRGVACTMNIKEHDRFGSAAIFSGIKQAKSKLGIKPDRFPVGVNHYEPTPNGRANLG